VAIVNRGFFVTPGEIIFLGAQEGLFFFDACGVPPFYESRSKKPFCMKSLSTPVGKKGVSRRERGKPSS